MGVSSVAQSRGARRRRRRAERRIDSSIALPHEGREKWAVTLEGHVLEVDGEGLAEGTVATAGTRRTAERFAAGVSRTRSGHVGVRFRKRGLMHFHTSIGVTEPDPDYDADAEHAVLVAVLRDPASHPRSPGESRRRDSLPQEATHCGGASEVRQ